jgi:hypothetical protein
MDDDDVYAPGGLEKMRRFAREHPGRIGIFKMEHPVGTTHWRKDEPVLRFANVSSQNFLVPNVPGRLGRWTDRPPRPGGGVYDGDYAFIARTVELQGERSSWTSDCLRRPVVRNPVRLLWIRLRHGPGCGRGCADEVLFVTTTGNGSVPSGRHLRS